MTTSTLNHADSLTRRQASLLRASKSIVLHAKVFHCSKSLMPVRSASVVSVKPVLMFSWLSKGPGGNVLGVLPLVAGLSPFSWILDDPLSYFTFFHLHMQGIGIGLGLLGWVRVWSFSTS